MEILRRRWEEVVSLAANAKYVFYHATSRKNLPSILKEGLLPEKSRRKMIWLLDDPDYAFFYALYKEDGVVLKCFLDKKPEVIYDWGRKEYATEERIPPENIAVLGEKERKQAYRSRIFKQFWIEEKE
jgi:RNA:NAD 2'-phosphotransferase (TPT1/KptA family)